MTLEELKNFAYLGKEIKRIEFEIERLTAIAERITSVISDMPRGSANNDRLTDTLSKIFEYQVELADLLEKQAKEHMRISRYINSIDSAMLRTIFKLRFIELKEWEQVADEIGGGNTGASCKMMCYRYINNSEG